jgi:predicted nucleotidyltransferase
MREAILAELQSIEKRKQVCILYAVESGSRGWGFASSDSDYDVRFIHVHPTEWYLSIDEKRDVIECPISDALDISGWDLRKALKLFSKSNPPLLEWLRSPIVYVEKSQRAEKLRELVPSFFSPKSCLYHYLHMAQGNFREYLRGEQVRIKKYFYVLRPVLACKWIENRNTMPPMEFEKLVETEVQDRRLADEINNLLQRKKGGEELDIERQIPLMNDFLEREIEHYSHYVRTIEKTPPPDHGVLDKFFRETLKEVWG